MSTPLVRPAATGYSGTPLAGKLGLKPGFTIKLVNPPGPYHELVPGLPAGLSFTQPKGPFHFIHVFVTTEQELSRSLAGLKDQVFPDGIIWISWPKKSAKTGSLVDEHMVRHAGLQAGLVDIKVCAVSNVWSGLKFVIPVKDRRPPK